MYNKYIEQNVKNKFQLNYYLKNKFKYLKKNLLGGMTAWAKLAKTPIIAIATIILKLFVYLIPTIPKDCYI